MGRCLALAVVLTGCGTDVITPGPDAATPIHIPGEPGVGAHGLAFYRFSQNSPTTISLPTMSTQTTGSTMIVSEGRGNRFVFAPPTDNKGNAPYQQLDESRSYTRYPDSGTALYAVPSMAGGDGHVITTTTLPQDEITLAAVEVLDGSRVQQFVWSEQLAAPLTSQSVTTTGPATLVAFWWGDGGITPDKTATPNNGFFVIDSILLAGELVQCAVAVKNVSEAGTYDVTWTATPAQGAQLWLVAVQ